MNDGTSIQELRVSVLAAVLEACREHGLPAPMTVDVTDFGMPSIELRFDEDQTEHVDAWVKHLGLTDAEDVLFDAKPEPWVSHKSKMVDHGGGLWLGAQIVEVWCSVHDKPAVAAAVARAALEA